MLEVYISGIGSCAIRFKSKLFIDNFSANQELITLDLTCNVGFDWLKFRKRSAQVLSHANDELLTRELSVVSSLNISSKFWDRNVCAKPWKFLSVSQAAQVFQHSFNRLVLITFRNILAQTTKPRALLYIHHWSTSSHLDFTTTPFWPEKKLDQFLDACSPVKVNWRFRSDPSLLPPS